MIKQAVNYISFPLRLITPQKWLHRLSLNTLADDRVEMVIPYVKGKLLDIGCGENLLVKQWGDGVGVDVYNWPGVDIMCDTTKLPFKDNTFDTITFLASLNHIPEREKVLLEAKRVLQPQGKVIVTMISKSVGVWCHRLIAHWDTDQKERQMDKKETWGLNNNEVLSLLENAGFKSVKKISFGFFNLNSLYIASK